MGGDDLDQAEADLSECSMATPRACASPDEPEVEVVQFDGQVTINFTLTSEPDLRSFLATQFATQLNVDPADLEISVDDESGNFTIWQPPQQLFKRQMLPSHLLPASLSALHPLALREPKDSKEIQLK